MRLLPLILLAPFLLGLTACTDPGIYAGVGIGPNGVSVTPVATARVGGARVSIRP
ncbi:hypothetical protein [Pseudorhodobacter turbinis]|uniref:hypothetical protein n=1 Tax=Pseudorhodobacter turbinis TaxID=2500533 RepID=UPI00143E03BE|nr:hypothetical protein [Pseudorhodobacter turbinis]